MRLKLLLATAAAAAVMTAASTETASAQARPAASAARPGAIVIPPINYTTRTLPNGLKVYAVRDPKTANVSVQMWYDVGAKDDPEGRSGFAHLFEHILSRVTRNISPGELSRIVEDAGGSRNASTGADFTNYFETVPANQLEAMLWAHAERMGKSVLDQSVFEAERNIVKEELRQRVLAEPYGRLQRFAAFENSFESHPYKRPSIGSIAHLDSAKLEDARAFHENYYRPDNATLIVAGNFDPQQLNSWIDKHFAGIERPNKPILRFDGRERQRTAPKTVTYYAPNVPLPAVLYTWQTPKVNHPDTAALTVLDAIMSSGQSSRLYNSLVYDKQLAQSANTLNFGLEDAGFFGAQAIVAGGKKIEDVEAALAAEVARLRDQPVSAEELAEAKTEYLSGELSNRETAEGKGFAIGYALTSTGDPRWNDKLLAAVQRVTPADIQRVARQYLRDDRRVSIRYVDESTRPAQQAAEAATPSTPLGLTLPAATKTPNVLAPEGQRMAVPAPTAPRPFVPPTFAERTLPNGLRVVVAKSTDVPVSAAYVVFGGGSSTDPTDRPGVASMTASLADNGTRSLSAPELARRIEALGADLGGSAGFDSTTMFVSAPTANIEAAGQLLGQVLREPAFAAAEVERERKRTLDALSVNLRQPGFVASQALGRVLYGPAPYGAPSVGTQASLTAMTRDDLARYHQTWWRPDNATVVITGSMTPQQGFALAERLFGGWTRPTTALPALPADRAGAASAPRVVVVDLPGSGQAAVSVAMRAINRKDPDFYPLNLANSVLGGSSTARLFQEVRVKRALSYGANSGLVARRDEGFLVASSQTKNESAAEVAEVMLGEIQRLAREPVPADTLEKRKTFVTGNFARQVETTSGLGAFLAGLATQDLPMTEYNRYAANLQAVTPQQLAASVAAELDPAQASIVIVGDSKAFLEPLRAKHANVEVIPLAELDLGLPTLRKPGGAAAATR